MQDFAKGFLEFSDASPTPFHACKKSAETLEAAGFVKIFEDQPWSETIEKGGKYYFTRNASTLCAFIVGGKYKSGNGFKIIAAHTDSPVLKVKPVSKREASGVEQVGVETYGGGLWHTWFDRDLGIAGRVITRLENGDFWQELVHIKKPILRIPNLAIHLQSSSERSAFAPNKETHLVPILSSMSEELNTPVDPKLDTRHSPKLLTLLANELGCKPEDIVDFELSLTDTYPAALGGANEEFVFAPRLDNQLHCYIGTQAISAVAKTIDANEEGILMFHMFDHEEVGSGSNEGAGSPLMRDAIQRLLQVFYAQEKETSGQKFLSDELFKIGLAKSFHISSDCSHAVHPNYASKHDVNHSPKMGGGTVLNINSNQDFATNAVTGFVLKELARQNKVGYFEDEATGFLPIPIQEFMGKNGQASGSTIGPILSSGVGIRTVDAGVPQLSMHSIREQCGSKDLYSTFYLFQAFYKFALQVDASLNPADSAF